MKKILTPLQPNSIKSKTLKNVEIDNELLDAVKPILEENGWTWKQGFTWGLQALILTHRPKVAAKLGIVSDSV